MSNPRNAAAQQEPADELRPIAVGNVAELWSTCPHCDGAGYYLEAVPFGHPHFGELFPCVCKLAEKERAARDALKRASGLDTDAWRDKTFDTFDATVAGVSGAARRAKAFATAPCGFLSLFGGPGCGKTHLAAAIANAALVRDIGTYLGTVPDLLDRLRSGYNADNPVGYDRLMEEVRDVQLLVLDDLGTENSTAWAKEKLFQIINHRWAYRLATVVTCNVPPEQIDPRIISRLGDRALAADGIITIKAADYRSTDRRAV